MGKTPDQDRGFRQRVWQEAEPIIVHAIIVLLLEVSLLLVGLLTLGLEHIFPNQRAYFSVIEKVDIWLALALLCMFGLYTLILVGIRLGKGLIEEIRGEALAKKGGRYND
jgi:hypothetical protein